MYENTSALKARMFRATLAMFCEVCFLFDYREVNDTLWAIISNAWKLKIVFRPNERCLHL